MEGTLSALILICSATLTVPNCTTSTATDVVQGPEVNSVWECGFASQAMIASTALGPGLGKTQYLKIVCVPKEKVASLLDHR